MFFKKFSTCLMYHVDVRHHLGSKTHKPHGLHSRFYQCLKPTDSYAARQEKDRQVDGDYLTSAPRYRDSDRGGGQMDSIPPPVLLLSFKVGHTFLHTLCLGNLTKSACNVLSAVKSEYDVGFKN